MKEKEDILLTETFVDSSLVFAGKILRVHKDHVLLPNGVTATREVVDHPGAVAIVPFTAEGKVILVQQYRYPVAKILWEIPAGKLDPGEAPELCAHRELEEETGYKAGELSKLTAVYTTPGFSNEIIHLYLAKQLVATQQNPDEDEFLRVAEFTAEQISVMLKNGEICDAKSMIALLLAGIS